MSVATVTITSVPPESKARVARIIWAFTGFSESGLENDLEGLPIELNHFGTETAKVLASRLKQQGAAVISTNNNVTPIRPGLPEASGTATLDVDDLHLTLTRLTRWSILSTRPRSMALRT